MWRYKGKLKGQRVKIYMIYSSQITVNFSPSLISCQHSHAPLNPEIYHILSESCSGLEHSPGTWRIPGHVDTQGCFLSFSGTLLWWTALLAVLLLLKQGGAGVLQWTSSQVGLPEWRDMAKTCQGKSDLSIQPKVRIQSNHISKNWSKATISAKLI